MKRKVLVVMILLYCMWAGQKEYVSAEKIRDYTVATKDDGEKTSIDNVSKNDFMNYLCSVKYQGENTHYEDLTEYLYSRSSCHTIPGLKNTNIMGENCSTMVPQGICRMKGYILFTAYDSENEYKSVIYVMSSTGKTLYATLVYPFKSHVGGIAYDGSNVYVCNSTKKTVSVFDKEYIMGAIHLSVQYKLNSVKLTEYDNIKVKTKASYCTYYDKRLWVGAYNDKKTDKIFGYRIRDKETDPSLNADRYIEAPQYAQGITFYDGDYDYFIVSCSWGIMDSTLRCYKLKDYDEPQKQYRKGIQRIQKGSAYKVISMPCMSEQLDVYGNKLYLLFESAADKYRDIPFVAETDCYLIFDWNKIVA